MVKAKKQNTSLYGLIPLVIAVTILPLIVFLKVIPINDISYNYWIGQKDNYDFFSYYKAALLIIITVISIGIFFIERNKSTFKLKNLIIYYVSVAVYAITIILSSILSRYPSVVWKGFVDRYEGALVLLSYLILLFVTINLLNTEKHFTILITGLFISATIIGVIGICQYFGADIFKTVFGKKLILPTQYYAHINSLDFQFDKHTIYSTLYNTNYVGSYMSIILPMAFTVFIYAKNTKNKIYTGLFTVLMFANWIGCRSRTGYIGGAIAIIVLIVILRKYVIQKYKQILALVACCAIVFFGMDAAADGILGGNYIQSLINKTTSAPVKTQNTAANNYNANIKDIVIDDNKIVIVEEEATLGFLLEENQVSFLDQDGNPLTIIKDESGKITFENPPYSFYTLEYTEDQNVFIVNMNEMQLRVYVGQDGFKVVGERGILLSDIERPEKVGFEGKEKFASSRGYIWSRSIPLLANNIIIGGGPDTYAIQFPQHDYVGKLKAFDNVNQIVDKPHNMFLQIGINTGVISLIAVLVLLGFYLIQSFRLYINNTDTSVISIIGRSAFVGVIGYCVVSFANDSLVSVAPVFWVVLGMGISCNYIIKLHNKEINNGTKKSI